MKTYEEMAQSVIRRAKTHRTIRNRCILGATAAVCVLGISLGVMAAREPANQEPLTLQTPAATEPAAPQEPRITMLCNNGSQTTEMQVGVESPCRMEIRVRDISGLTEDEIAAVREAEQKYADDLIASHPDCKGYATAQYGGDNVVMTCISAGHFILGMDDPSLLESIYVTVEGTIDPLYLTPVNENLENLEYCLDGEAIERHYYEPYGGIEIGWMFNSALFYWEYDKNPVPLSNLGDTISIAVTFKDGTVENYAIDFVFNDGGEVYAIYRGLEAAA